jgi:hypothetical protein
MKHKGGCHCGNISVVFESDLDPGEIELRACQCSFCRKHNAWSVSDPQGALTIKVADGSKLNRYMFGLETAEFLICRDCGVYVGAATLDPADPRGIVIIDVLDDRPSFTRDPVDMTYDAEDKDQRLKRREHKWMPVSIVG